VNNGPNHLHGGPSGFHAQVWGEASLSASAQAAVLRLALVSPDGHEGYPGALSVVASYALTAANQLVMHFHADTTQPTVVKHRPQRQRQQAHRRLGRVGR
jgi:aldose 1-epimerase